MDKMERYLLLPFLSTLFQQDLYLFKALSLVHKLHTIFSCLSQGLLKHGTNGKLGMSHTYLKFPELHNAKSRENVFLNFSL